MCLMTSAKTVFTSRFYVGERNQSTYSKCITHPPGKSFRYSAENKEGKLSRPHCLVQSHSPRDDYICSGCPKPSAPGSGLHVGPALLDSVKGDHTAFPRPVPDPCLVPQGRGIWGLTSHLDWMITSAMCTRGRPSIYSLSAAYSHMASELGMIFTFNPKRQQYFMAAKIRRFKFQCV
jgi:hypothetical protein